MLKLYGHPLSSFTQKALIALYDLGEPFEFVFIGPKNPDGMAELEQLWPYRKFPVLRDGDLVLPEATLIIEYLAERAPDAGLVPADAVQRTEARLIDRVIDNYVAAPQFRMVAEHFRGDDRKDPRGVAEAGVMLDTSYAWLEKRLESRHWAAGDAFTLADCGAAPMLFYADWFYPMGERYPTLSAYFERLRERPSVKRAFDEARPYHHMVPGGVPGHVV